MLTHREAARQQIMARINTNRKSGFILRGGAMRRETLWFQGVLVRQGLTAASTASLVSQLNAAALALRPFTVVRTRGIFAVRSDQIAAAEFQDAAYGMAVVSDQAAAIGVTAVPTPATDNGSDLWYVYERLVGQLEFASGVGFEPQMFEQQKVDSKAMRKVEEGQILVEVIETGALSSGVSVITFQRTLIKLH